MRAKAIYLDNPLAPWLGPGREYTFEVPNDTVVGDRFRDGEREAVVKVVELLYDGPVRTLTRRLPRRKEKA